MYIRVVTSAALVLSGSVLAVGQSPFDSLREIATSLESAVRSQSEQSNRPSMAMIDRETARSMNYDNQLKHVSTYFEKRQMNRKYRDSLRPRRSGAQITAAAQRSAPDRLTSQQYDPYGGRINWPVALKTADYAQSRQQVDQLFAAHARAGGGINTNYYAPIHSAIDALQKQLTGNFKQTDASQWAYARKFLTSLQYEAKIPVGS